MAIINFFTVQTSPPSNDDDAGGRGYEVYHAYGKKSEELWNYIKDNGERDDKEPSGTKKLKIHYIRYNYYVGWGWFPEPEMEVLDYQIKKPEEPKYDYYTRQKTYIPEQYVASFSNLHRAWVSILPSARPPEITDPSNKIGWIKYVWRTEPNLYLHVSEGWPDYLKIISIRFWTPNLWEIFTENPVSSNVLHTFIVKAVAPFERDLKKPYTIADEESILTAHNWKGEMRYQLRFDKDEVRYLHETRQLETQWGHKDLENGVPKGVKEKIQGLHNLFSNQHVMEEITETVIPSDPKTPPYEKVVSRNYLLLCKHRGTKNPVVNSVNNVSSNVLSTPTIPKGSGCFSGSCEIINYDTLSETEKIDFDAKLKQQSEI